MAKVKVVAVDEELGEVEELRDELLDIVDVAVQVLPGLRDRVELPVGDVEPAALE
jgi:hypothetical protein